MRAASLVVHLADPGERGVCLDDQAECRRRPVASLYRPGLAWVVSWRVLSPYARTESGLNLLDTLASCAGDWRGTSTLQDPHANIADASPSTATVTALPEGQVRLDYTWAY